ncbi:MAG: hypothetical protein COA78_38440 [Blastopirellula sp.]|nr:MAG: hypothetical protein COA78_38440 [Blastopirellula sp.]
MKILTHKSLIAPYNVTKMLTHGEDLHLVDVTINGVERRNLSHKAAARLPNLPKNYAIRLTAIAACLADRMRYKADYNEVDMPIIEEPIPA